MKMTNHAHGARWGRWGRGLLLLGIAGAWLASERPVFAEGSNIEVLLQVKPPDRNNPKTKDDAPQIEATIIGAANLPSDKFTLREEGAKQPVEIKPLSKREYNQGTEKLAIAIVLNGWEIWIGNDDVLAEDDPSRYPGVLKSLEAALDKVNFKDAGPSGRTSSLPIQISQPFITIAIASFSLPWVYSRLEIGFSSTGCLAPSSRSVNFSPGRLGAPITVASICGASSLVLGLLRSGGLTSIRTSMLDASA